MDFTFLSNNPLLRQVVVEADDEDRARELAMLALHGPYDSKVPVGHRSGNGLIRLY